MQRFRRSRGQAIVLVTLGLLAMCGLMGLAVDVGWSMFVEKQAQAAADTAALASVEEAISRLTVTNTFSCSASTSVSCSPNPVNCASLSSTTTNNLWNGCLYAMKNGFNDGSTSPVQAVTIQANDGSNPPTMLAPGVNDIAYWVTVRTTQQIPQLFSTVLGNSQGVAATAATAAIVATVVPSSFYALNREGDCTSIAGPNTYSAGFDKFCGVDVNINGGAGQPSVICPGGGVQANICAADGIVLSSTCHGDGTQAGCSDPNGNGNGGGGGGGGGNWAGQTTNGGGGTNVWALSAQVRSQGANTGDVNNHSNWSPVPTATTNPGTFQDPYKGLPNPSLAIPTAGGNQLGLCGIPSGLISNGTSSQVVLGPFQYYATDAAGNPTGNPIVLSGNIAFAAGGSCSNPSGLPPFYTPGAGPLDPAFPGYMFYGGLDTGNQTHFGPGQYISIGVKNQQTPSLIIGGGNRTITGDTSAGTQFVTTNPSNPDLATYMTGNLASLRSTVRYFGGIQLKGGASTSLQLAGINKNAALGNASYLGQYANNMIWQDWNNTTMLMDAVGNVVGQPCLNGCTSIPASLDNLGVTVYSPEFNYQAALQMNLAGTIHQPRGAWTRIQANTDVSSALRIITGMIWMQGNGTVHLLPTAAPIIRYTVALIH